MSSLLKKMKLGSENRKTIKFPGTDQDIVIKILSDLEKQEAAVAAYNYMKINDMPYDVLATSDIYEDELVSQCLWRACLNPENQYEKFATTVKEFKKITTDEKSYLTNVYNNFEQECSPVVEDMTEDQFKSLVEDLKKNVKSTLSNISDMSTLKRVISFLVNSDVS